MDKDLADRMRKSLKLIREDCLLDVESKTPFTPSGIGGLLGGMSAQIDTLAGMVELLVDELEKK